MKANIFFFNFRDVTSRLPPRGGCSDTCRSSTATWPSPGPGPGPTPAPSAARSSANQANSLSTSKPTALSHTTSIPVISVERSLHDPSMWTDTNSCIRASGLILVRRVIKRLPGRISWRCTWRAAAPASTWTSAWTAGRTVSWWRPRTAPCQGCPPIWRLGWSGSLCVKF